MTVMIDGRGTAEKIRSQLKQKTEQLKQQGLEPCLADRKSTRLNSSH